MRALVSTQEGKKVLSQLMEVQRPTCRPSQVLIRTEFSSINYKDALAVTGSGLIFKKFPIIGGIDTAGVVCESQSTKFKVGDLVLVTGCGLGETHDGGFAEYVLENEENVIALPDGLSLKEAMILGTAGFTAALALERMINNGQTPQMGPILVTGASGGVGQFATSIFSKAGFSVIAASSKTAAFPRLKELGAESVSNLEELCLEEKPLASIRFGGAVDNVGGGLLAKILSHTALWGNVASIGLTGGHSLNSTVMPHILRGVSLLGISSNNTPRPLREKIWAKLSKALKPPELDSFVYKTIGLEEINTAAQGLLQRQVMGRILVKI